MEKHWISIYMSVKNNEVELENVWTTWCLSLTTRFESMLQVVCLCDGCLCKGTYRIAVHVIARTVVTLDEPCYGHVKWVRDMCRRTEDGGDSTASFSWNTCGVIIREETEEREPSTQNQHHFEDHCLHAQTDIWPRIRSQFPPLPFQPIRVPSLHEINWETKTSKEPVDPWW